MRNNQLPPMFPPQRVQCVQENHRIHASGNRDHDRNGVREQIASADLLFDAADQLAHRGMLDFVPTRRERDCEPAAD